MPCVLEGRLQRTIAWVVGLSVVCQWVMTKDHIKTPFFRHIVLKESILPWREFCVEYIMVWMTESQSVPEPWCCSSKTQLRCRQETSAYLPHQAPSKHGVLRSEVKVSGLRWQVNLRSVNLILIACHMNWWSKINLTGRSLATTSCWKSKKLGWQNMLPEERNVKLVVCFRGGLIGMTETWKIILEDALLAN